ncbi:MULTISPECIES: peroxiredoxin family protein [Bacillaceae]|uniref:peroxiredoxin family protein n=1 Tax=Bacillaceae TaxID=186817 RepID=UPI002880CAEC|nr:MULTISPECIES: redoxin domain-containing protein [Bacillus]MDT0161182.1 redoxin domain-containing protein [Bacillus sp. AG4(2022)]MDW2879627.1 redoxin domain-containing protein [Bacillus infantis]
MKKNIIAASIMAIAIAIVLVNVWKSSPPEEPVQTSTEEEESPPASSAPEEGAVPPDFELTTLAGETVRLSDYKGQKVILNFWATWCPPCKAEMPHMQKFYEENKDKDVEILAVNLTNADNGTKAIESFVQEYGLTFPIPLDQDGQLGVQYQVFSIPTSYIIDTNGVVSKKIIGPMDEEMIKNLVK